ncbi:MAG: hypothetical protein GF311_02875 [Candidatus Lokiarchaeota archaeon]|nr:hypothetical protein [Candidatus Lokiarchaeota archaeon]
MNVKKSIKPAFLFGLIIMSCLFLYFEVSEGSNEMRQETALKSSSMNSNYGLLMGTMDGICDQYNSNGFFPTLYCPSLQGCYFALSCYSMIGRLEDVNTTEVLDYIFDHYDYESNYFIDEYAIRYLNTDFEEYYLPLNTLLEVNSYAILSLGILDQLEIINTESMVDFLWSCSHPTEGGFIGQPFNEDLHDNFKIPTLDNTYFAVKALDMLIDDWEAYQTECSLLLAYITECQSMTQSDGFYGGFENDLDPSFDSLDTLDPNLVSSYYALKTLDILNALQAIDLDAFHEYLSDMYHPAEYYFDLTWAEIAPSFGIPAATSVGLDLSVLTGFEGVAELEIFNYLNSIQNSIGLWPTSLEYSQFELIDIFQVLRSLNESGYIDYFTPIEKDEIADGLNHFKSYEAYSTTPINLERISRIFSVAQSFTLFDRWTDLAMHEIYSDIRDAYFDPFGKNYRGFYAYTNTGGNYFPFRIYPIEYFNVGNYSSLEYTEHLRNHKTVLHALLALQNLYKLDDFENYYDLSDILNSTLDAQIISPVSERFGAFLPTNALRIYSQERQDKYIFMDQSYYAVRLLEFLSNYLGLAPIEDLIVDVDALKTFVFDTFESPGEYCYSMPRDTDNVNIILKNTYFASYIMTALDSFTQNTEKIKNYLLDHIDYTNLENIYYCWKLDQLLKMNISFDIKRVQTIISELYSDELNNFFCSLNRKKMSHEALYWICDMARNGEIEYKLFFDQIIELGSNFTLRVDVNNIVLDGLTDYDSFKFESLQLGEYQLIHTGDGRFENELYIPIIQSNYPIIVGNITRYKYFRKVDQIPISIETRYELITDVKAVKKVNSIDLSVNISILSGATHHSLENGTVWTNITCNGEVIEEKSFLTDSFGSYVLCFLHYKYSTFGNYNFELFVNDGINQSDHLIQTISHSYTYDLRYNISILHKSTQIEFLVNTSRILNNESFPLIEGKIYLDVFHENYFFRVQQYTEYTTERCSLFEINYQLNQSGTYNFIIFLSDGINIERLKLGSFAYTHINDANDPGAPNYMNVEMLSYFALINVLGLLGCTITIHYLRKKPIR